MDQSYIPQGYAPRLNLYDTQKAIGLLKRLFEDTLGGALNLMVLLVCLSAPAYVVNRVLDLTGNFLASGFLNFYLGMFFYGLLTVLSEWRHIRATGWQKLKYLALFPLFMLTYIPISVAALFQKVEWKPITHKSMAQIDTAV